jgi:hypothetical protein
MCTFCCFYVETGITKPSDVIHWLCVQVVSAVARGCCVSSDSGTQLVLHNSFSITSRLWLVKGVNCVHYWFYPCAPVHLILLWRHSVANPLFCNHARSEIGQYLILQNLHIFCSHLLWFSSFICNFVATLHLSMCSLNSTFRSEDYIKAFCGPELF